MYIFSSPRRGQVSGDRKAVRYIGVSQKTPCAACDGKDTPYVGLETLQSPTSTNSC